MQEEADTRVVKHIAFSIIKDDISHAVVRSPSGDTDIVVKIVRIN